MNRERRAVVHHVQAGPVPLVGWKSGALLSRSARVGVPLSDIPAGCSKVQGVVSAHTRSAATVTQAGGDECALPAFSSFVQAPAPSWRPWTRVWNSEASRGERGGHDRLEPVGGA